MFATFPIHFIRPHWFWGLLPLFFLLLLLRKYVHQGNCWQRVIDKHLLPHLLIQTHKFSTLWPLLFLSLFWCVAIFALAGPSWQRLAQPVFRDQNAKVIVLDLSQSMLARDIPPSRLNRAKYKIMDILDQYPEGLTGMAVFSREAYTVSPLTNDTHTIAAMVPVLSPRIMPVFGSNLGEGLKQGERLLKQGGAKSGLILLITDSQVSAADDRIAKAIHRQGYRISVLGVGTLQGAPIPSIDGGFVTDDKKTVIAKLPVAPLKKLAALGGGRFHVFTNNDDDITALLKPSLENHLFQNAKPVQAKATIWQDRGRWFIFLLLPLALLVFRRGWLEEILS